MSPEYLASVAALDAAADPDYCAALIWAGTPWGPTPEPDELCAECAEAGSDFCHNHREKD